MTQQKLRILVVSGRLLMAQGIVSLLEGTPNIEHVEVVDNLYDALVYCKYSPPDAMVLDLPSGADYFVDRPVYVEGREIKTIVLLEDEESRRGHLYVHTPRRTANLQNLVWAILLDGDSEAEELSTGDDLPLTAESMSDQPNSFIKARASGPKRLRISPSKAEL